jgi:Winged helix DNA-binding domain
LTIDTVSGQMIMSTESLDDAKTVEGTKRDMLLLPGFDEYLLGYKDRSAMLNPDYSNRIIPGGNGVFKPTIVVEGRVVGIWQRTIKKQRVDIEAQPFEAFTKRQQQTFEASSRTYADYLGLEANIK